MESCRMDAYTQCPAVRNATNLSQLDLCAWQNEYLVALQSSGETRIWNKAKDLLYGYALIWITMCMPRIYHCLRNLPLKRFFFNMAERRRRPRTVTTPVASSASAAGNPRQYLDSGCPVCLATPEEMSDLTPVHGECGHALCVECFVGMWNHSKAWTLYPLSCPLCTAALHKISPVKKWEASEPSTSEPSASEPFDTRMEKFDRSVRRYNLVFSGSCVGILPTSPKSLFYLFSRTLRLGYFFVLFDRKMMNTISFFLMHFVLAVVVEYFESTYLQNLLEHL